MRPFRNSVLVTILFCFTARSAYGTPSNLRNNNGFPGFACKSMTKDEGICGEYKACKGGTIKKGMCRGRSNNVCCVEPKAGDPGGPCKKAIGTCMHPNGCTGGEVAAGKGCNGGKLNKCCLSNGDASKTQGNRNAHETETNNEAADSASQNFDEKADKQEESEEEENRAKKFYSDADFDTTATGREKQAEQILKQSGVRFERNIGRVYMIQIDQKTPKTNSEIRKYTKFYTGKTCAFQVTENGTLAELGGPWISASHAHWKGGGLIPHCKNGFCTKSPHGKEKACKSDAVCNTVGYQSVDGDYRYELARLPPGQYEYRAQYRKNCKAKRNLVVGLKRKVSVSGCWAMKNHRVQTYRDLNHDGRISEKEKAKLYTATGILLHSGYQSKFDYDKCCESQGNVRKRCRSYCKKTGPSSAGCQTLPPTDWDEMTRVVNHATQKKGTFTYVLVLREWTGDQW